MFRHYYAHHQKLRWLLPVVLDVWLSSCRSGVELWVVYPVCGMQQMVLYCKNIFFAQHVSDTIMPIIRSSRVLYRWLLPVVLGALAFKLSVWCGAVGCVSDNLKAKAPSTTGSNHLYNTFELLMMGIVVPETCRANNKFLQ